MLTLVACAPLFYVSQDRLCQHQQFLSVSVEWVVSATEWLGQWHWWHHCYWNLQEPLNPKIKDSIKLLCNHLFSWVQIFVNWENLYSRYLSSRYCQSLLSWKKTCSLVNILICVSTVSLKSIKKMVSHEKLLTYFNLFLGSRNKTTCKVNLNCISR